MVEFRDIWCLVRSGFDLTVPPIFPFHIRAKYASNEPKQKENKTIDPIQTIFNLIGLHMHVRIFCPNNIIADNVEVIRCYIFNQNVTVIMLQKNIKK